MDKNIIITVAAILGVAFIGLAALTTISDDTKACTAAGGVLIRGVDGTLCISRSVIIKY